MLTHWLQVWADCVQEDGDMPHTAPSPWQAGGGPYWTGFIITSSWDTYLNYGDVKVLENHYPVMQKWLRFVDTHTVDGLLQRWASTKYKSWYLGDWATPEGVDQTNSKSVDLVSNCYISTCYDKISKIAKVLGKSSDSELYSAKRDTLNEKIHETFFNESNFSYSTGTQIDLVYPMLVGAVPEIYINEVTDYLMQTTDDKYDGHLSTGLVGVPIIMEWATKSNNPDFIYSMLKKKGYPGYLYMLENGATTTWEHWNGQRSRIHNCYNGVGQWFYQALAGIRPLEDNVGYSEFLIHPQTPKGVNWVKSKVETSMGTIMVNWNIKGNKMNIEIAVPIGSIAKLCLPLGTEMININNRQITSPSDTLNFKSGEYLVEYPI